MKNTSGRGRLDVFLPERRKLKAMTEDQKRKGNIEKI